MDLELCRLRRAHNYSVVREASPAQARESPMRNVTDWPIAKTISRIR